MTNWAEQQVGEGTLGRGLRLECLRRVEDDSEQTIERLLDLARTEQGLERREQVPLHELAAATVLTLGPEADERGITLNLNLQPLQVTGDPVLLSRLLHNLLSTSATTHPAKASASVCPSWRRSRVPTEPRQAPSPTREAGSRCGSSSPPLSDHHAPSVTASCAPNPRRGRASARCRAWPDQRVRGACSSSSSSSGRCTSLTEMFTSTTSSPVIQPTAEVTSSRTVLATSVIETP